MSPIIYFLVIAILWFAPTVASAKRICEEFFDPMALKALKQIPLRRDGVLIPADAVPGYSAAFNGDLHPLAAEPGHYLAAVRLARTGYEKVFTGTGLRGYEIKGPYISDVGLFRVDLMRNRYEFVGILAATDFRMPEHLANVRALAAQNPSETSSRCLRSLEKIAAGKDHLIPEDLILEDPRFMATADEKLYLFTTAVPKALLSGEGGKHKESYGMAAIEVELTGDRSQPLKTKSFKSFGPSENKDTGFFPVANSPTLRAEMAQIYRGIDLPMPAVTHPIMLLTRIGGDIQMIPMPSVVAALAVPEAKFVEIYRKQLHRKVFQPDKNFYRSVGNNDQPFAINLPGHEGHLLYLFHATESQQYDPAFPKRPTLSYVTYAAILDRRGYVIAVSPGPIQEPEAAYEVEGDVNWVLFNSGNAVVGEDLVMFNGTGDKVVAPARMPVSALVDFLMRYGKVTDYDPRQGIIIDKPARLVN